MASITPFSIDQPANFNQFSESNLASPAQFRTPLQEVPNVTQAMVDNPNIVLAQAIAGQNIVSTETLSISTMPLNPPASGGGASNIAFLVGSPNGANAQSAQVDATFWIQTVRMADGSTRQQLQYTQRVLLNFSTLSWPHVSVATLLKI